jgi:Uma2 family endonuclease
MGEVGVFGADTRLELIEGSIYELPPISSAHAGCVTFLSMFLCQLFSEGLIVSAQNPIRLSDFSEPQPDIALPRWRDDFYRRRHPTPADVLLVIEVADTTVGTDRAVKVPLYAAAGIPETWIVNLPDEQIEVYAGPADGTFRVGKHYRRGARAQSHTLDNLSAVVAEVLG